MQTTINENPCIRIGHRATARILVSRVRARTALVNTARGLAKSYGEQLRGCNVRNMNPEKAEGLSPELQTALEPLLACIESVSGQIREYNERIETLARQSYPQVALLKQVKGVGPLIALTFVLTGSPGSNRNNRIQGANQMAAPAETRTPNLQRAITITPRSS